MTEILRRCLGQIVYDIGNSYVDHGEIIHLQEFGENVLPVAVAYRLQSGAAKGKVTGSNPCRGSRILMGAKFNSTRDPYVGGTLKIPWR